MRRDDVAATLIRRPFGTKYPQGALILIFSIGYRRHVHVRACLLAHVRHLTHFIMLTVVHLFIHLFFFIFVFQEYFSYIESIVEQRWAKTGVPGEKPPDLTEAERGFLTCAPSEA